MSHIFIRKRLRFYPIVGIIFLAVVLFIMISASGYDFIYRNGKLSTTRTGTIILQTRPGDAKIYLDNKLLKKRTPFLTFMNLTLDRITPGKHIIKLEKPGFENWVGEIYVEAGKVYWGVELILVAQKRESVPFNINGRVTQTIKDSKNTKLAVISQNDENGYTTISEITTNSQVLKKIADIKTVSGIIYTLDSYSWDTSKILVSVLDGSVNNKLIYDTKDNGKFYDLSKIYGTNYQKISFNPRNENEIFAFDNGFLKKISYTQGRTGPSLDSNVLSVHPSSQGLLFVKEGKATKELWRLDINEKPDLVIPNIGISGAYQISYVPSQNAYLILGATSKELTLYSKARGKYEITKVLSKNSNYFVLSPETNWIFFSGDGGYFTYDLERKKINTVFKNRKVENICWFEDEVNLIYSEEGKMKLVTREGVYDKYLFGVNPKFEVVVSPNSNFIYFTDNNPSTKITDVFVYRLNY